MTRVTIAPGDWLGAIAERYGVADPETIWNAPANAGLRATRKTPDFLMVGDELEIPEQAGDGIEVLVEGTTRVTLVRRRTLATLRVRVAGIEGLLAAFGPVDYVLEAGAARVEGRIERADALLEIQLSRDVTAATLWLMGRRMPEIAVGGLGPIEEPRGAYQRLVNLGFVADPDSPAAGSESAVDPLAAAVAAFQRSRGTAPTGVLDDATREALRSAYDG